MPIVKIEMGTLYICVIETHILKNSVCTPMKFRIRPMFFLFFDASKTQGASTTFCRWLGNIISHSVVSVNIKEDLVLTEIEQFLLKNIRILSKNAEQFSVNINTNLKEDFS